MITCTSHGKPVALGDGPVIRHAGGGYCRSDTFTTGELTREQAMGLLLHAHGKTILARTVTGQAT